MTESIVGVLGDEHSFVGLVQHVGSDKMIVNAARASFGGENNNSLSPGDIKLLKYLLREHHGSPFEHNLITFKVVCPIFVDRQMVRHRMFSKNEISGRYVEVQERVFTPTTFRKQAASNRQASEEDDGTIPQGYALKQWELATLTALDCYYRLLSCGVTREQARGILPQTMYTESYYTVNVRSLLHFLELRDHPGAQYETQLFARAMKQLSEPLFPETFKAWEELTSHV